MDDKELAKVFRHIANKLDPPVVVEPPKPDQPPRGDLPGWKLIFSETFDTPAAEGEFTEKYRDKWDAYPTTYMDTSKKGQYNPGIISVRDGVMTMRLHMNINGRPQVAAPMPRINGPKADLNQRYGRYEVRFRADPVNGYKTAWLLWPQSEEWPRDGEIDFPEGNLNETIGAFMHWQAGKDGDDQDPFKTDVRFNDWHTAIIEWMPSRVNFILDGKTIGSSTNRIPNTPMRWVLQTETELNNVYPARAAVALVQVSDVYVWKYAP